jgi:hypothetical protein
MRGLLRAQGRAVPTPFNSHTDVALLFPTNATPINTATALQTALISRRRHEQIGRVGRSGAVVKMVQ